MRPISKYLISPIVNTSSVIALLAVFGALSQGCVIDCDEGQLKNAYAEGRLQAQKDMNRLHQEGFQQGLIDYGPEKLTASDGEADGTRQGQDEGFTVGFNNPQRGYPAGFSVGHPIGFAQGIDDPLAAANGADAGFLDGRYDGLIAGQADGFKDGYNEGYDFGYTRGLLSCVFGADAEEINQCYDQGYKNTYIGNRFNVGYEAGRNERLDDDFDRDNVAYLEARDAAYKAAYATAVLEGEIAGYNNGVTDGKTAGFLEATTLTYENAYRTQYHRAFDSGYAEGYSDRFFGFGKAPLLAFDVYSGLGGFGAGYGDGYDDGYVACLYGISDGAGLTSVKKWGSSPAWIRSHTPLDPRKLRRAFAETVEKRKHDMEDGIESLRETLLEELRVEARLSL